MFLEPTLALFDTFWLFDQPFLTKEEFQQWWNLYFLSSFLCVYSNLCVPLHFDLVFWYIQLINLYWLIDSIIHLICFRQNHDSKHIHFLSQGFIQLKISFIQKYIFFSFKSVIHFFENWRIEQGLHQFKYIMLTYWILGWQHKYSFKSCCAAISKRWPRF